jgi:hypothetical protein
MTASFDSCEDGASGRGEGPPARGRASTQAVTVRMTALTSSSTSSAARPVRTPCRMTVAMPSDLSNVPSAVV